MWRHRPGVLVVFIYVINGGRDLSQYIKKGVSSFERVRPSSRGEPSPQQVAVGHLVCRE